MLEERELAALRPGVPRDLDRRPDVLVVGGGAQGLAAAAACRAAGLGRVLLIERDRLASGPSGSAAGLLCPEAHLAAEGEAFVRFAQSSMERYAALAAEAGDALRLRRRDWLALGAAATAAGIDGLPGVQRLDADDVRRLVPQLAEPLAGLLLPNCQAHLNPARLAVVLAARAGTVATGVEYLGLRARGGRVEAVRTSHGDLYPGAVVLATGLAPAELLPLQQERVAGHLVATEPAPFAFPLGLNAPGASVAQLENGGLLTGGDQVPDDGSGAVDERTVERFHAGLGRLLPAAGGLRRTHAWRCARPATADRLPVIDRAPGLDNVWLTAGHYTTGLLLAPAAGHAIATWIATGRPPELAAPFGIGRSSSGVR